MKIRNRIVGGILAVAVIGVGLFSGCNDMTADIPSLPSQGIGNTVITEETENGLELTTVKLLAEEYVEYGINAQAESAYTLNVTYKPSYVTNADVSWDLEFVDSNSEWAAGKTVTDYITLSGNNNKATVSVNKAFGEQIKITVSSVENPNVKASCVCDYVVAVSQVDVRFIGIDNGFGTSDLYYRIKLGTDPNVSKFGQFSDFSKSYPISSMKGILDFDVTYSPGTIRPEASDVKFRCSYEPSHLDIFNTYLNKTYVKISTDSSFWNNRVVYDENNVVCGVLYSESDEICMALPFIEFLDESSRTLIVQSYDYLWGHTTEVPENWNNGAAYRSYVNAVSKVLETVGLEKISVTYHCDVAGARNENLFSTYGFMTTWSPMCFEIPVVNVSTNVSSYEF